MDQCADYAEPDLPPSRLPSLGTLAGWLVLSILAVLFVAMRWAKYW